MEENYENRTREGRKQKEAAKKQSVGFATAVFPKVQSNIELDALKMSSKPGDPKSCLHLESTHF